LTCNSWALSLWGNTAARVQETLAILDELIDSDPQTLEAFISRIPMVFRIVLSPTVGLGKREFGAS